MKIKVDYFQAPNQLRSTPLQPLFLDLNQFSNNQINRTLEYNNNPIGQIIIKDNIFYLHLEENAPPVTISGLPLQKKLIIESASDITIAAKQNSTLEGMAINANNITIQTKLIISQGIILEGKQNVLIESSLSADKIVCYALNIENNGTVNAFSFLTLKATNIQQKGEIHSQALILNTDLLNVSEDSKIIIKESCLLLANVAELKGHLDLGSSLICIVVDLKLSGFLKNLNEAYFSCDYLQINNQASIEFNPIDTSVEEIRTIKVKKLSVFEGATAIFNKLTLTAIEMELNGSYLFRDCVCEIENNAYFKGDKSSLLENSIFEAERFFFSGDNILNNIECITDCMEFTANSRTHLKASKFDVLKHVTLHKSSFSHWDNCRLYTNSIQFKGYSEVINCTVESESCLTSAHTVLKSTALEARLFWKDKGAIIDSCSIIATSSHLYKKTLIEHSKISTNVINYNSVGILSECKLSVKDFFGSPASTLTFKHCLLETNQTYIQGTLNFTDKSYHQSNYMQQSTGEIKCDDSSMQIDGVLFSMSNTHLSVENNAKLNVKSALLSGSSTWKNSHLAAIGPLIFTGKVTTDSTAISSQENIYLAESTFDFKNSILDSNKQVIVTGDTTFAADSTIKCETFSVASTNCLLDHSKITASDLNIINKFCAKKSAVTLKRTLKSFSGSSTTIDKGVILADEMDFIGVMTLTRAELKAQTSIIFGHGSKTNLNHVKLYAEDTIANKMHAEIIGENVKMDSSHLENAGDLKIDNLTAQATTIYNSGSVISDQSVEFKVNLGMLNAGCISANRLKVQAISFMNFFGQIKSKESILIQAPLLINYLGDIHSSGSLSMDSVLHCNLLATERAFDYNSRSIYNCNYGLVIPSLPNSLQDIFTLSRAIAYTKMGLTQLLPSYANLISLGAMVIPYIEKGGNYLYDFYQSDESIADLPAKIYKSSVDSCKNFMGQFEINSTADLLPVIMNVMGTSLSLFQLASVVDGAHKQLSTKDSNSMSDATSGNVENNNSVGDIIGEVALNVFAPSINCQSLYGYNGGIVCSVNLMDSSSINEVNEGIKLGWNVVGNYNKTAVNQGIFGGANLVLQGGNYDNHGDLFNTKTAQLQFEGKFTNGQGAGLNLMKYRIQAKDFVDAGFVHLNDGRVEANSFLQTKSSKECLAKTTVIIQEDATLNGQYNFDEQTTFIANNVNLNHKGSISDSTVIAHNTLNQTGNLLGVEAKLTGKNVSLNGIDATDGKINALEELQIRNSNTLGTEITSENAHLIDSTFKGKPSEEKEIISNTQSPIDALHDTESGANSVVINKTLKTENVVFEGMKVSSNTHNDVNGTYIKTQVKANQDFTGHNAQLDSSTIFGTTIGLTGKTSVIDSHVIAQKKLTQVGELKGVNTSFAGEDVALSGADLLKSTVIADDTLSIINTRTVDTGLSGNALNLQDSTFKSSQPLNEPSVASQIATSEGLENDNGCEPPNSINSNEIKATESLYTKNVEIEGQSIHADKMDAISIKMKNTTVTVAKAFTATDINTDKATIYANTATFDDKIIMTDSFTSAKDSIVFNENASLKTHNVEYQSQNAITHKTKEHEQTGFLIFKSDNVQATESSNLFSGTSDDNTFYVESNTGNFKGSMKLDNGNFNVKHLNNAEDLIGQRGQSSDQIFNQSLTVQTNQNINIEKMKARDCNIAVIADEINVKEDYTSDRNVTFIATQKKVDIKANLTGQVVALQSEKDNVEIHGKTVSGKHYVHIEAKQNILITTTEEVYQGEYDIEKKYSKGQVIGGLGTEETEGAGVICHADGEIIVDASNVVAEGKAIISGDKGVKIKARTHTYTAEEWTKNKRVLGIKHGEKKYERIETQTCTSIIGSTQEQVQIISTEGGVTGEGGDFIAKDGTDIYAHKDISLKGIITDTQIRKKSSDGFGLHSKKSKETHEYVKFNDFQDDGGTTRLHSNTGDVKGVDVRFRGKGDIYFSAPDGNVDLRGSTLNHSYKSCETKFSVSSPVVDSVKRHVKDKKCFIKQVEPTLGNIEALLHAKNTLEVAASAANIATHGYNAANALQQGNFGQHLMQGTGFIPKVDFSLSKTKKSSHTQTGTGAGVFTDGKVVICSKKKVNLEAMGVTAKALKIKTHELTMKGQALESSLSRSNKKVTVGVNPATGGVTDVSVSMSSQKITSKQHQNMAVNIQEKVDIQADNMNMSAAYIDCDTSKIILDSLTVESKQDEFNSQSISANASTTGTVGYHQTQTQAREVNQVSGIHVRSGIAKDDMQIREVQLTGASITSDGYNGFEPEKLNTTTLRDYSNTDGFGISGNLDAVSNALNESIPKTSLTTINVSHEQRAYKARVQSTVYGTEGVNEILASNNKVNTNSAQAKIVTSDYSHQVAVDAPVEFIKSSVINGLSFFKKPVELNQTPCTLKKSEESGVSVCLIEEVPIVDTLEGAPLLTTPFSSSRVTSEESNTQDRAQSEIYTEEETTDDRKSGTFNPNVDVRNLSQKRGRYQDQLCNKDNGQYTTAEKELTMSADNSCVSGGVEIVLFEKGSKEEGLYGNAMYDPLNNQANFEAGIGKQVVLDIANECVELGALGQIGYAVDAASVNAAAYVQTKITPTSMSVSAQAELGVMGPSATVTYDPPSFSFMGLTFHVTAIGSAGVGAKITGGSGIDADLTKLSAGVVYKLGLFAGPGVQCSIKTEFGLDATFLKVHQDAFSEIFEKDAMAMIILEKKKNWQYVTDWESSYFDAVLDDVSSRAQSNSWFNCK